MTLEDWRSVRRLTKVMEEVAERVARRHRGPEVGYGIFAHHDASGAWVKRTSSEQPSGGWYHDHADPPKIGDVVRTWKVGADRWIERVGTNPLLTEHHDAFPMDPHPGALIWRSGLGKLFYWDAQIGRWLSVQLTIDTLQTNYSAAQPWTSTTSGAMRGVLSGGGRHDLYVEEWGIRFHQEAGGQIGQDNWTIQLIKVPTSQWVREQVDIFSTVDPSLGPLGYVPGTWYSIPRTPRKLLGGTQYVVWEIDVTKIGTPGALHLESHVLGREAYT